MKRTHDNNIMAYIYHQPWWSLRYDKGGSIIVTLNVESSFYEILTEKLPR